jgi:hypothetical protein
MAVYRLLNIHLIIRKIAFEINKKYEKIGYYFGKYNPNLLVFDGGLGSQIMNYYQFAFLIHNNYKVELNMEYFENPPSEYHDFFVLRKWALDRYGISIDSIKKQAHKITTNNAKIPSNLLAKNDKNYFKKFLDLDLSEIFPVDTLKLNEFLSKNNITSDYYAIHIRKGDALNTASKLVTEKDVQDLSLKLFEKLPKHPILIFSDSEIDSNVKSTLITLGYDNIFLFLPGSCSDFTVHDLLRNAKILVTSNSTFSLSAALLSRRSQLAFIPIEFYSGYRDGPTNELLNKLSKYAILS